MENNGATAPVNFRSKLTEQMMSRYPDRRYEADGDQPATHDLDESLYETLNSLTEKINGYEADRKRLRGVMKTPGGHAAKFLNTLVETGNGGRAFAAAYGVNAFKALGTEEAAQIIADAEAKDAEEQAQREAWKEEFKQNFKTSMSTLKSWGESKGLSEDQMMEVFTKLLDVLQDAEDGIYKQEIFEAVIKARDYDTAIESARNEGLVNGRNERIQQSSLRREAARQMPPTLSGRATQMAEEPSRKSKWGDYLK